MTLPDLGVLLALALLGWLESRAWRAEVRAWRTRPQKVRHALAPKTLAQLRAIGADLVRVATIGTATPGQSQPVTAAPDPEAAALHHARKESILQLATTLRQLYTDDGETVGLEQCLKEATELVNAG
jgi:hypothetical protein